MSWEQEYQSKLRTPEECAAIVQSGDSVWVGGLMQCPFHVVEALCARYEELENVSCYSGLMMAPVDFMFGHYKGHLNYECVFLGPVERMFYSQGNIRLNSYSFSRADALIKNVMKPRIAIFDIGAPDENGMMSFGPAATYNGWAIAEAADIVICQVNRETPWVFGGDKSFLHVSQVDYFCEADHGITELPDMGTGISEEDRKMAALVAERIPDGACLQLGLGGTPNAIAELLIDKKDLGVHAELIPDSVATLAEAGVINCSRKNFHPGKIVTPIGIGSSKIYKFMENNPMIETQPIAYVNNYENIGRNDNMASIQSALMVDLTGQVASESIGHSLQSGTGGQLDFVIGSKLSNGGQSFLCLKSSRYDKVAGAPASRIVNEFPPGTVITTPRSAVQYIVTEYGIADLQDKSIPDRIKAMVSIAHPDFRETLLGNAKAAGLLND